MAPFPSLTGRQLNPPTILDNSSPQDHKLLCSGSYCIPTNYNKIEPPISNQEPLQVNINIDKVRILEFDDKKFTISLSMFLAVQWKEGRMTGPPPSPTQPYQVSR